MTQTHHHIRCSIVILAITTLIIPTITCDDPTVTYADGTVRGLAMNDRKGNWFHSFRGLPYAKPPVGELRFKTAREPDPWTGVRNATSYSKDCPQGNVTNDSEDCLYLNVFVPKATNDTRPKAVMFYIYGGGFISGSGSSKQLGPDNLMPGDIILVTLNYRLGPLGYSSFTDPSIGVYGNEGLKDQVRALKWVQKNIAAFGGDPKRVTLVGNSSGGSCVHAHMLSKLSKGLFHAAIMQSGAIFYFTKPEVSTRQVAELLAANHTVKLETDWDVFNVLNASDAQVMHDIMVKLNPPKGSDLLGMIIESPQSPNPFLDKEPMELIKNHEFNDVPVMIGYMNEEGLITANDNEATQSLKYSWGPMTDLYQHLFGVSNFTRAKETGLADHLLKEVERFYFGNPAHSDVYNFFHMKMDMEFFMPVYDALKIQFLNDRSSCYVYRFTLDTEVNYEKRKKNLTTLRGATHADELGYLFKQDDYPIVIAGSAEDRGIDLVVTLWTNFIKTTNPNYPNNTYRARWNPADTDAFTYLEIDVPPKGPQAKYGVFPEQSRIDFWEWFRKRNARLEALSGRELGSIFDDDRARFYFVGPLLALVCVLIGVVIVGKVISLAKRRRHQFYQRI